MGTICSYKCPWKRGGGRRHQRKRGSTATPAKAGVTRQQAENVHNPQNLQRWLFPWSLQRQHGFANTLASAQGSWPFTSGFRMLREHTSVIWSHKEASRKPEQNPLVCAWASLQLLCRIPASLTQDKPQIRQKRSLPLKPWKFWSGHKEETNVQGPALENAVCKNAT